MTEEFFRDFWWLIFPVFGMVMSAFGLAQEFRRRDRVIRDACNRLERTL